MAAAGSLASSGPKRVMRGRFERHRMTIYYRWIANGGRAGRAGGPSAARAVYDNRAETSSPVAPSVRHEIRSTAEAIRGPVGTYRRVVCETVRYSCGDFFAFLSCYGVGESEQTNGVAAGEDVRQRHHQTIDNSTNHSPRT